MRLIDADALKNLPFHRLIHTDFGETAVSFEEIDNAPTIKSYTLEDLEKAKNNGYKWGRIAGKKERPQGEWKEKRDRIGGWVECDKCGHEPLRDFSLSIVLSNYCPNCGADMRKGGAE